MQQEQYSTTLNNRNQATNILINSATYKTTNFSICTNLHWNRQFKNKNNTTGFINITAPLFFLINNNVWLGKSNNNKRKKTVTTRTYCWMFFHFLIDCSYTYSIGIINNSSVKYKTIKNQKKNQSITLIINKKVKSNKKAQETKKGPKEWND